MTENRVSGRGVSGRKVVSISEFLELFFGGGAFGDFDDVEAHGLGKRTAFTDRHHVALSHVAEARRAVGRDVLVPLLKTLVLPDKVKIVSAHHDRPLHLHLLNHASQNPATDLNEASKGALLVDVNAIFCFIRRLESQTNILHVTNLFGVFST